MTKVSPHECLQTAAQFLPENLAEAAAYIDTLFQAYNMTFETQSSLVLALRAVVEAAKVSQWNESKEISLNLIYKKSKRKVAWTLLHIQLGINVMRPYFKLFLYNKKSRHYKVLKNQGFLEVLFEINAPANLPTREDAV